MGEAGENASAVSMTAVASTIRNRLAAGGYGGSPSGGRRSRQPATRSWPNELVLTSHFRLFHVAYDGLPTVIDVDVLDANVLLPTVTKPSKHFDLGRIGS